MKRKPKAGDDARASSGVEVVEIDGAALYLVLEDSPVWDGVPPQPKPIVGGIVKVHPPASASDEAVSRVVIALKGEGGAACVRVVRRETSPEQAVAAPIVAAKVRARDVRKVVHSVLVELRREDKEVVVEELEAAMSAVGL